MLAENRIVPSLTFEVLRVATGSPTILIRTENTGLKGVRIPGFELPTDAHGLVWLHFAPHDRSIYVSAADVLEGRVPPDRFAGKFVFIGASAVGLSDLKTTATAPAMPGVEVHAQVLENILENSVLTAPNYALALELVVAVIVGLIAIALVPALGP